MRIATLIIAVLALCLAQTATVEGHTALHHSVPAAGSTMPEPPAHVVLQFTEALEPDFCSIEVLDDAGERVDDLDLQVHAADPTVLSVPLRPLAAGSYKVIWRAVSLDSHVAMGDFTFRVAPP